MQLKSQIRLFAYPFLSILGATTASEKQTILQSINKFLNYITDEYRWISWMFSGLALAVIGGFLGPRLYKKIKNIKAIDGGAVQIKVASSKKNSTEVTSVEARGKGSKVDIDS